MKAAVRKWGNSYAVRLPKLIVEEAGLREGSELELRVPRPGSVNLRIEKPKLTLGAMARRIKPDNFHEEAEWGRSVGREVW
jgi:antitoxin MazE